MRIRCCRSEPRCKACPIMLSKELRDVRDLGLGGTATDLPPHLAGLPECLHKYGPLFAPLPDADELPRGESAA